MKTSKNTTKHNTAKSLLAGVVCSMVLMTTMLAPTTVAAAVETYMPEETAQHEATWLQWPHHYTYGKTYRERLDETWVAMTKALVSSEKVHIIAYNRAEQKCIQSLLSRAKIPLTNIDFTIRRTDDVWVRDNGPVFVYDHNAQLKMTDWGFNGWGFDTPYRKDDRVPAAVQKKLGVPRINLNDVVLEGGAVEVDGNGTLMATRSSVLGPLRNPGISEREMEGLFETYLGATNVIWLDGAPGGKEDITDTHIDGFARFGNEDTIVTMGMNDLFYWGLGTHDIDTLYAARDVEGARYDYLYLPLTRNNVRTAYGKNLGYKGSYVNYYVANSVVLMPAYNDPNDRVARAKLQKLYPNRTVISIDVRNLYENGGMIHCVTQQQPVAF